MTTLEEKSKRFYGSAAPDFNQQIESFFARQEARHIHKNDQEGLAKARAARADLVKFAGKHRMTADDVRIALSALTDHETYPRHDEAAIQARWTRNFEAMAQKHGGPEAARAVVDAANKFQREFKEANPYLAQRMLETGAASAPEIVEVSAKYGADKS